jgi:hypothetical protein
MRFLVLRIEAILLSLIFIGAFTAAIYSGDASWFAIIWIVTGIGIFHLNRLKCPRCKEKIMRRRTKYFYVGRIFFPKKCDKCGFDLTTL